MPAGKLVNATMTWLATTTTLAMAMVIAVVMAMPAAAGAETTRIPVHVLSQDAKLIGSGVGGAWVTVTDAATGEMLAQGAHRGATGDTQRIMRLDPQERDTVLFDTEGAAVFVAEFDIDEPTVVRIGATGPLGNPDASMRATTEMLVTPGAEITGDGVVLTLHGLNIEILEAAAGTADEPVRVLVNVGMMCGCPLTPGGLWDAGTVELTARLLRDGKVVATGALDYAGEPSRFDGAVTPPGPGAYTLEVIGAQPSKANFGRARMPLAIGD
ncbi:hypothetical protein [Lentisalinibacter orientalis]|uniref:hypothetical protein n=1 Tax=Lentisalinibacter orientalis TaxID=2992241 RepID=UPI00386CD832